VRRAGRIEAVPSRWRDSTGKAEALRSIPGFAALPHRDRAQLLRLFDEVRVPPATVLRGAGQVTRELVLIVDGQATATDRRGRETPVGAGQVVGDVAIRAHAEPAMTVIADTPMSLLVAGPRAVRSALDHPWVLRHIATTIADQLEGPPVAVRRLAG